MIKISILYPNQPGGRFDMDYYLNRHMPMSIDLLSAHAGFKGVSVEHGLSGDAPGKEAAYLIMCHFLFDSVESFLAAYTPNSAALQSDMPNYTDITSTIQISEVVISR